MDRSEIKARIARNLEEAGLPLEDDGIRVQADPYLGWRIAVISSGFAGMPPAERRRVALQGLEAEVLQWVDLLSPAEREWAGSLPLDADLEDLPLWPEALARPAPGDPVLFASDLDVDLERPVIATFYSLRGGVGRSTALAYTAQVLARRGRSVLCVDLDLEAPGLAALLGFEGEVKQNSGVVDLLLRLEQGESPDLIEHIVRVSTSDELYCLPAGVPNADYARRLRLINPEDWYRQEHNPIRRFVDMASELPFKPDVILMDARTGLSPISSPLLFDLSDLAVITFFPHPQALTGTRELVRALLRARSRRVYSGRYLTPEPRFIVSPIPPRELQRYKHRAEEWTQDWLLEVNSARTGQQGLSELEPQDIVHVVPYREVIAGSDRTLRDEDIERLYEPVADWIERFLPSKAETAVAQTLPESKAAILEQLSFATGTAETQDDFLETFVPTEVFLKASAEDRPLVVGRKGTGKTALFRWLLEGSQARSAVVMCPAQFRPTYPWVLSSDGFKSIDATLRMGDGGWREFWVLYTALACHQALVQAGHDSVMPHPQLVPVLDHLLHVIAAPELDYVQKLQQALQVPSIGLLAWDWLQRLDRAASGQMFLLYDGLDTGFGNTERDRARRKEGLEGLFTFLLDREKALGRLRFKVLMREDIWNTLRFENKSHLSVRAVRLEWRTEADYARTIIKQALRNEPFAAYVQRFIGTTRQFPVELWPDETVVNVWNLLVGERMKGGKSTYTLTWVWNRLADGNGDHSPRSVFQLFSRATAWERQEQRTNPYDKSVIRPRALIVALEDVSRQALQSLLEEFSELTPLTARLEAIGRSPVEATQLDVTAEQHALTEHVALGREVGLLQVYEETEDEVRRYRVPDLYRIALGMKRKGQA